MSEKEKDVKEELDNLKKERDKYKEKYLRKLAEFDNFRKMMEKEIEKEKKILEAGIIKEFLEPYESLEKAIEYDKNLNDGIKLVYKNMKKILEKHNVKEIKAKGKKFNPNLHEAIGVVDGEEDNIVMEEYQRGYMIGDMVLRHSKVIVSKKGGEEE
ncbi:MAG: nucleotide exchange factor GrpE [Thermoplasmata archaeon]|nr:nucleotide exchange factor GrpE [Thermoplasmata archaeon]